MARLVFFLLALLYVVAGRPSQSVKSIDEFNRLLDALTPPSVVLAPHQPQLKAVGRKRIGSIRDGQSIEIVGQVDEEAKRFNVTLRSADNVEDPLTLSFGFKKEEVILNSFFGGGWDVPEHRRSSLRAGDDFKIVIYLGYNEFLIIVNDHWKARYSNRVDFTNLSSVIVTGDAVLEKIEHYRAENEEDESGENVYRK